MGAFQLARRIAAAQEMVSSGLLKMVEVFGVFVTLGRLPRWLGNRRDQGADFEQRAIAMVLVVVGSVVFFGLLRLITGTRQRKRDLLARVGPCRR